MSEAVIDLHSRAAGIDINQALAVVSAIVPIGSDPFRCKFGIRPYNYTLL